MKTLDASAPVVKTAERQPQYCCIAQVRALLERVRSRQLPRPAAPWGDEPLRIVHEEDFAKPSPHDLHVGELEASVLAGFSHATASHATEIRYDDPRELARARLIFALTWLLPLLLVSAVLVFFGTALGQALGSLLRFSVVMMAVPLAGSLVAVLVRGLQRKRTGLSRAASRRD